MSPPPTLPLPCVLHVGFGGSRKLFDAADGDPAALADELRRLLVERLKKLRADLKLGDEYVLCGISQVAVGADAVFTTACRDAGMLQRVLLPQHVHDYLTASGSGGPDFTTAEQQDAEHLLAEPHVIEVRVVADSADRHGRFEQTNFEITRLSDVVICLTRAGSVSRPGGTKELLDKAKTRMTRALEIEVAVRDGKLDLKEEWHPYDKGGAPVVPRLPEELEGVRMPAPDAATADTVFRKTLKEFASSKSKRRKWLFASAALLIVASHILATVFAAVFQVVHRPEPPVPVPAAPVADLAPPAADPPVVDPPAVARGTGHVPVWQRWLLGVELGLLVVGATLHWFVHKSEVARTWAVARVMAEAARSVDALAKRPLHLGYLFQLPMPARLRPVLRTLNVYHLCATRKAAGDGPDWWRAAVGDWQDHRTEYVAKRLTDGHRGQIAFYTKKLRAARRWVAVARFGFWVLAVLAMTAVVVKLLVYSELVMLPGPAPDLLSVVTVVFPVLAVGVLSLTAAMDYFALSNIYSEMVPYLDAQAERLAEARSAHEFDRLVFETEARLLGETVNWFFRRSFTEVT